MALTTRQEITLYSILRVPYSPRIQRLIDVDNMLAQEYQPNNPEFWSRTKIQARLAEIALLPEVEADLVYCLDRWYEMFGDSTEMASGSTGATTGVSFSLNNEREQLRERILAMVPFSREYLSEELGKVYQEKISVSAIR